MQPYFSIYWTKSYGVTIHMKPVKQCFNMILFLPLVSLIALYKFVIIWSVDRMSILHCGRSLAQLCPQGFKGKALRTGLSLALFNMVQFLFNEE